MAQTLPGVWRPGLGVVGQISFVAVPDKKQVAQHLNTAALLALAQQGRHRHAQVLAEQIEQRAFDGGHGVHGGTQIKGLLATAAAVAPGKSLLYVLQHLLVRANRLADDQFSGVLQGLPNLFASGHFAHAGAASAVG